MNAPPFPWACVWVGLVTHRGYHLCKGMCARCLATNTCLICTDWSGIERRAPLPVRDHLRRAPWHLQVPRDHPEACALAISSLSRGWTDDHENPFIVTDLPLAYAEWLPWAGQA